MKILNFLILAVFIHGYPSCSMASPATDPVWQEKVTAQAFITSATVSQAINAPMAKMVAVTIVKTGTGKGAAKLQGSVDNANWKDINTTTYPDATATVVSGSTTATMSLIANPFPFIRYLFTEDGTNPGNITGGLWSTK
jgi:hypothetical protein